jgi:hypothetical protein
VLLLHRSKHLLHLKPELTKFEEVLLQENLLLFLLYSKVHQSEELPKIPMRMISKNQHLHTKVVIV